MIAQWHAVHTQAHLLLQSMWGIFAFSYALERRSRFWLRMVLSVLVGMTLVDLCSAALRPLKMAGEILTIVLLYLLLIAILRFCHKISLWSAMFTVSSGYIAQDIASRFKYLLRLNPAVNEFFPTSLGVAVSDILCYGGVFLLAYFIFRRQTGRGEEIFDNKIKAIFSVLVLGICVGMPRLAFAGGPPNTTLLLAMILYQIFCGCFILIAQYGTLERADLSHQVDAMKELLHQQKVQYETSKENAQLVNEKYHDLKKMFNQLRDRVPAQELEQMEWHISAYDMAVQTGSEVLDVVLAEKRIQCGQWEIQITCYADGTALNFVEELDLYSLLNNALTNAMEATVKLPAGERFITLTVAREGEMASIHVENSCSEPVELEDGLPKSRRDPRYHGFGMKSMARVAEKYGGSLVVEYREHMFNLDIILFAQGK